MYAPGIILYFICKMYMHTYSVLFDHLPFLQKFPHLILPYPTLPSPSSLDPSQREKPSDKVGVHMYVLPQCSEDSTVSFVLQ